MIKEVMVKSDTCMCCGSTERLTNHHAIPQRMEPKENAIVVVCRNCHDNIHSDDVEGLKGLVYKQFKTLSRNVKKITDLTIGNMLIKKNKR